MKKGKLIIGVAAMAVIPFAARADGLTLAQVTQQITAASPLKLRDDVAQDFAENLLQAQANAYYTAFEPDSLQLSITALIKAIGLDKQAKDHYCDDSNCSIAWGQSKVAIDDRGVVVITAASLADPSTSTFPTSTPEPSSLPLLLTGLTLIAVKKREG